MQEALQGHPAVRVRLVCQDFSRIVAVEFLIGSVKPFPPAALVEKTVAQAVKVSLAMQVTRVPLVEAQRRSESISQLTRVMRSRCLQTSMWLGSLNNATA